jgi:hypothetical protein
MIRTYVHPANVEKLRRIVILQKVQAAHIRLLCSTAENRFRTDYVVGVQLHYPSNLRPILKRHMIRLSFVVTLACNMDIESLDTVYLWKNS